MSALKTKKTLPSYALAVSFDRYDEGICAKYGQVYEQKGVTEPLKKHETKMAICHDQEDREADRHVAGREGG